MLFQLFLLPSVTNVNGQVRDTIYVYDTVRTYETIIVKARPKVPNQLSGLKYAILSVDSVATNGELWLFFADSSATIPVNGIILSENYKNSKSMKKITFLSLMLVALQQMVLSQTEFGIDAGTMVLLKNHQSVFNAPVTDLGVKIEGFARHKLGQNYALRIGLGFGIINGKAESNQFKSEILDNSYDHHFLVNRSNFNVFTMPVILSRPGGRINPFFGLRYNYRFSQKKLEDVDGFMFGGNPGEKYAISMSYFSGLAGVGINILPKVSLLLEYSYGLYSPNYVFTSNTSKVFVSNDQLKNHLLNVSLAYTFKKRDSE